MFKMRRRDPRFALLGPRSGARATVKFATLFAFKWWFLTKFILPSFGAAAWDNRISKGFSFHNYANLIGIFSCIFGICQSFNPSMKLTSLLKVLTPKYEYLRALKSNCCHF